MASRIQNEKKIVAVSEIGKGMKLCTIEVRIIRVWERPNFKNQLETESIEMVLMDSEVMSLHEIFFNFIYFINNMVYLIFIYFINREVRFKLAVEKA